MEKLVVMMILGLAPLPDRPEVRELVLQYREYHNERMGCVSYPRNKDAEMDAVFDLICESV